MERTPIVASYYNLNKTYIWFSFIIIFIIIVAVYWLITLINGKTGTDACSDPVALFFDTRMRQRCMTKQWENDMGWLSQNMEDKFLMLHKTQDYLNSRIDDVLGKYTAENTSTFNAAIDDLRQKDAAIGALRSNILQTHELVKQNKQGLTDLWNYWQQRLVEIKQQTIDYLINKRIATNNTVNKLISIQRNKHKANKRKKLVKKYDKNKKFLDKMSQKPEYASLGLFVNELPKEARYGKK